MMNKTLYLPNSARPRGVESEVTREQRQLMEEVDEVTGRLAHYKHLLEEKYPGVKLVMAKPRTETLGLKPGFYHLVFEVPGVGTWIEPYQGPDGEWRDLDDGILTLAAESDTWDDRVRRDIAEQRRQAEIERQNAANRLSQDRAHEFDTRLKSAQNVSISVSKEIH